MQHLNYASVTLKLNQMPSNRKRIGFLPTAEVQEIINNICSSENISQSKVTGILVNEALKARYSKVEKFETQHHHKDFSDIEFNMVKDFLEYKRFKNMIRKAISEEKT